MQFCLEKWQECCAFQTFFSCICRIKDTTGKGKEIKRQAGRKVEVEWAWKASRVSQGSRQSDGGFAGCRFNKQVILLCWLASVLCRHDWNLNSQSWYPHSSCVTAAEAIFAAFSIHRWSDEQCYIWTWFYRIATKITSSAYADLTKNTFNRHKITRCDLHVLRTSFKIQNMQYASWWHLKKKLSDLRSFQKSVKMLHSSSLRCLKYSSFEALKCFLTLLCVHVCACAALEFLGWLWIGCVGLI